MRAIPRKSSAAILFTTYVCVEVVFVTAIVSGTTLQAVFEMSRTQLGVCLGAAQFGILVASMLIGPLTHRHGPLSIVTAALAGLLLALVLVIAAPNFLVLFVGLAGAGICAAALHNGGVTLLSSIFPQNVRRVMAFASALWFGSSVLAAPLIGMWLDLMARHDTRVWGYRAPLLIVFVLLAGCLALVRWRLRWAPRLHAREQERRLGDAVTGRWRALWQPLVASGSWKWLWIIAMAFCHGMLLSGLMAWLSPMAQSVFGVSELKGGAVFAVAVLGLAVGRLLLAARSLAVEDRLLLAVSGFTGASLLALGLAAPSYWITLLLVGVGMFATSATAPCLFSLVATRFTHVRAYVYAAMEAGIASGAMLGAFLVGFLSDHGIAIRLAMGLSPVAAGALAALSLGWRFTERAPR